MTTTYEAEMLFQDELPRIRCGQRTTIVQLGRKWATFIEKGTKRKGRLPLNSERCQNLLRRTVKKV
jgi:hypothetical protein